MPVVVNILVLRRDRGLEIRAKTFRTRLYTAKTYWEDGGRPAVTLTASPSFPSALMITFLSLIKLSVRLTRLSSTIWYGAATYTPGQYVILGVAAEEVAKERLARHGKAV